MKKTIKEFEIFTFSGTYGSIWELDPDLSMVSDEVAEHLEFDGEGWLKAIAEDYPRQFCYMLEDYCGIKATAANIEAWSPSEYNFLTDEIFCDLTIENWDEVKPRLLKWMDDNRDKVAKAIKDKFGSRDGFISFYNSDFDVWRRNVVEDNDHEDERDDEMSRTDYLICLWLASRYDSERIEISYDMMDDVDEHIYEYLTCNGLIADEYVYCEDPEMDARLRTEIENA